MKILSILKTAGLSRSGDGIELVLAQLVEEGHVVHVVAPERESLTDRLEARGVQIHLHAELPVIDGRQLHTVGGWVNLLGAIPFSVWTLARLVRRLEIDVVHTNTLLTPVGAMIASVTGRPHVWHARELVRGCGWLHRAYLAWVVRGAGGMKKSVVAVSESTRSQFSLEARGKVRVIYDGLDTTAWRLDAVWVQGFRERFVAGATVVGVVGRVRWHRQGQEVVVRAASILREKYPLVRFVFVGEPVRGEEEEAARLVELIGVYGLENVVTLMETPAKESMPSLYAGLDVLVAPLLRSKPLDRGALAAMAVGTVVVGSQCGGVSELVEYGESGLLFAAGDFEQLAQELELLLNYQETRERLADGARAKVGERFNWKKTAWEMGGELKRMGRRLG